MEKNEYYITDLLNLSAFLLVREVRLLRVTEIRPRHFNFVFENKTLCEELEQEYSNNGTCSARELFNRRLELLNKINNAGNGELNYGTKFYK